MSFGTLRSDLPTSWANRPVANDALTSTRALVVGGTGGIGQAMARLLAQRGAEVTVIGRTFRDENHIPRINFIKADLSELDEAQRVAKQVVPETLDLVIFTQGIFVGSERKTNSKGIELDLATSYLSRLVMLREMAPKLGKSRPSTKKTNHKPRVFIMGFPGSGVKVPTLDDFNQDRSYSGITTHMNGVVGNEALVLDSQTRYKNINVYGLNPGIMSSNIMTEMLGGEKSWLLWIQRGIIGMIFPSVEQYAERILPLLVADEIEEESGACFGRMGDAIHHNPWLELEGNVERVMQASEKVMAERST
ncbi:hypothetical protein HDU76_000108 [Blyttiomyces sp. JEL0837]|nr:hypothetical protein HDU76_000108 [Blyttiomyces sp. JEL0837]